MKELESLLRVLVDAGLEMVEFSSPSAKLRFEARSKDETERMAERGTRGEWDEGSGEGADGMKNRHRPTLLLLRSPVAGVMGRTWAGEGEEVAGEGIRLGEILTLMGGRPLAAPRGCRLLRWIAREGQAVGYEQPLLLMEVLEGEWDDAR